MFSGLPSIAACSVLIAFVLGAPVVPQDAVVPEATHATDQVEEPSRAPESSLDEYYGHYSSYSSSSRRRPSSYHSSSTSSGHKATIIPCRTAGGRELLGTNCGTKNADPPPATRAVACRNPPTDELGADLDAAESQAEALATAKEKAKALVQSSHHTSQATNAIDWSEVDSWLEKAAEHGWVAIESELDTIDTLVQQIEQTKKDMQNVDLMKPTLEEAGTYINQLDQRINSYPPLTERIWLDRKKYLRNWEKTKLSVEDMAKVAKPVFANEESKGNVPDNDWPQEQFSYRSIQLLDTALYQTTVMIDLGKKIAELISAHFHILSILGSECESATGRLKAYTKKLQTVTRKVKNEGSWGTW